MTRPETGPMKFGTDPAGVFVGPKSARLFAASLRMFVDAHQSPDATMLLAIVTILESCTETNACFQHLRPFGECLAVSEPPWGGVNRVILLNGLRSEHLPNGYPVGSKGYVMGFGPDFFQVVFDVLPGIIITFDPSAWLKAVAPEPRDTDRAPAPTDWAAFASAAHPVVEECPATPRDPSVAYPDDTEPSKGDEPR